MIESINVDRFFLVVAVVVLVVLVDAWSICGMSGPIGNVTPYFKKMAHMYYVCQSFFFQHTYKWIENVCFVLEYHCFFV